jgi:hypothetical protein
MFCHSASATSKAASSSGGVVAALTAAAGRRATTVAGLSRHGGCRLELKPPATHSCQCGPHPHHHQSQRNSEIHKFQRVSRPISISTENPNGGLSLPFCASEYEVRRYPKNACDWTNNDQQDAAHSFLFWPSWEVQNICCNVRAMFFLRRCDIGQMCLWAAERPTKVT